MDIAILSRTAALDWMQIADNAGETASSMVMPVEYSKCHPPSVIERSHGVA